MEARKVQMIVVIYLIASSSWLLWSLTKNKEKEKQFEANIEQRCDTIIEESQKKFEADFARWKSEKEREFERQKPQKQEENTEDQTKNKSVHSFLKRVQKALDAFDWTDIDREFKEQQGNTLIRLSTTCLERINTLLAPFLEEEPPAPITVSKRPPFELNCENPKYSAVLTGEKRKNPVKVYDLFPFSSELDMLEIRLYELNETVDAFGLIESTVTHRGSKKPLFFARNAERYSAFNGKLFHFVMDDTDALHYHPVKQQQGDDWKVEHFTRELLWTKFVKGFGMPEDNDILIHGDLDEIPDSDLIYQLKHCEVKNLPATVGTYMYNFDFDTIYNDETRFPTVGTVKTLDLSHGFKRILPSTMVHWAGAHITYYPNPASLVYKNMALAEGGQVPRNDLRFLKNITLTFEETRKRKRICCQGDNIPSLDSSRVPKPAFVPWFAKANKKRFPLLFPTKDRNYEY